MMLRLTGNGFNIEGCGVLSRFRNVKDGLGGDESSPVFLGPSKMFLGPLSIRERERSSIGDWL